MAIKNASDLLVYAKTASAAAQKTRIRVLTTDPIEVPDGGTTGTVKINNITNDSGVISDDISTAASTNTGSTVLAAINTVLTSATYDYVDSSGSDQTDGDYTYRDFTNGAVGIVPTLEIVSGTATLNEGAIIIEIITPGSSAIFDPVAFSTSASFSTNMDLRDVTNKDSEGWSESLPGLKSFEISTDSLQSVNPDTPLDGSDFFDKLKQDLPTNALVDLTFSDRISNIIRTNLTQIGVDGFTAAATTQVNLQTDPFGGFTASSIEATSSANSRLQFVMEAGRIEAKKLTWSFYIKGDGTTTKATMTIPYGSLNNATLSTIGGNGSETISAYSAGGSGFYKIENLDTTWVRVVAEFPNLYDVAGPDNDIYFRVFPGLSAAQSSDKIFISSWQLEHSHTVTDYQDPTNITHWQGNALVSSLSFDAGVEDNYVCSATFTGDGHLYPNGLGPELITDTGFDDPSYWSVTSPSVVENGYGKIISTGADSNIYKAGLMAGAGNYYLLTYTVSSGATPSGSIKVIDGWTTGDPILPSSVGTHSVLLKPDNTELRINRVAACTVWLSSISLKKVL
tara:strand:- start:5459 stop:7159 length:1701 start_codon:yes stop_codon:yes gene_type:complete